MNTVDLKSSGLQPVTAGVAEPFRDAPAPGEASPSGTGYGQPPAAGGAPAPEQAETARESRVSEAVSNLNDYVQSVQRDLEFEVDRDLGQTIVRVIDRETGEVIRQIPDEIALKLAEKLQQDEPLTLFSVRV